MNPNARAFEGLADGREVTLGWHPAAVLEFHNDVTVNNCDAR
jgi:hypothetical protein